MFGSGGDNAPVLLVVGDHRASLDAADAGMVVAAALQAAPGGRIVSFADQRVY